VPVARWHLAAGSVLFILLGILLGLLRRPSVPDVLARVATAVPFVGPSGQRLTQRTKDPVWMLYGGFKWKLSPELAAYEGPAAVCSTGSLDGLIKGPFCPTENCLRQRVEQAGSGYSVRYV